MVQLMITGFCLLFSHWCNINSIRNICMFSFTFNVVYFQTLFSFRYCTNIIMSKQEKIIPKRFKFLFGGLAG